MNSTSSLARLIAFTAVIPLVSLFAADPPPSPHEPVDKNQYHLFNPTPREHLRDLSTDRPDVTESPYTVDAGHFQIEMDFFTYTHDRETDAGVRTRVDEWAIAPINLKVGLCNQADLQIVLETWNYARTKTGGTAPSTSQHQRGFGDVTARVKYNVWGNDGGATAFALLPFIKLPTNQDDLGNNGVEGGIALPFAFELPGEFGVGLMTEFDFVREPSDSDYHTEFLNSVAIGHDIVGNLGGYVEFFAITGTESDTGWMGAIGLGLTYGISEDIQLDGGVNVGVTSSAPDVNPLLGISWRF